MIFGVSIVIVLGAPERGPCETADLAINVGCALNAPTAGCPALSPLRRPLSSLRRNSVEIGPVSNPTVASKCPNKGQASHVPHFKSNPEKVKFSEEGPFVPANHVATAKAKFLTEIKGLHRWLWMIRKGNGLIADAERVRVVWTEGPAGHDVPFS